MGFEPTILASERAMTVPVLDRPATVTGILRHILFYLFQLVLRVSGIYNLIRSKVVEVSFVKESDNVAVTDHYFPASFPILCHITEL
jgi:hypothetical protein